MALDNNDDPYFTPAPRRRNVSPDDPNVQELSNPAVKGFLDKISQAEGADYNTLVGGRRINDLSQHPNIVGVRTSAGPSTAFGRYQITGTTDRSKLNKYSDLDYSPPNQDVRAVELLRQTGALDALKAGDEPTAIRRAGREWASLPGSPLPGRKRTDVFRQARTDPYFTPAPQTPKQTASAPEVDPYFTPATASGEPSVVDPTGVNGPRFTGVGEPPPVTPVPTVTVPPIQRAARRPDQLTPRIARQLSPPPGKTVDNSMLVQPSARSVLGIAPPVGQQLGETTAETYQTPLSKNIKVLPGEMYAPPEKENAADQQWRQQHEPEIAAQTEAMRKVIREQGGPKWVNEAAAQGVGSWGSTAAGLAKNAWMLNPALGLASLAVGDTGSADKIRVMAEATKRAAIAEGAGRRRASLFAQSLLGGAIASAPALAAMSAGVPAPVAFGAQAAAEAQGSGGTVGQTIGAAAHGAKQGVAWEVPVPGAAGLAGRPVASALAKGATVGTATGAADIGEGRPLGEVAQSALTNALMAGGGELLKPAEPHHSQFQVKDEEGKFAGPVDTEAYEAAKTEPTPQPAPIEQPSTPSVGAAAPLPEPGMRAGNEPEAPTTPAGGNEPAATSPAEGVVPTALPTSEEAGKVGKELAVPPVETKPSPELSLPPVKPGENATVAAARARLAAKGPANIADFFKSEKGEFDPQQLVDFLTVHGYDLYQSGKAKFEDWRDAMREKFGEKAEPYLKTAWAGIRGTDTIKESLRLPLIEQRAHLNRPFEMTYESESGKQIVRKMTVGERQDQLVKKERMLERLVDCLHA